MASCCEHFRRERELALPLKHTALYKDECIYCFHGVKDGLYLCLHCFQGFCPEHRPLHFEKTAGLHELYLEIHQTALEQGEAETERKLTKLEIQPETETEYEYEYNFYCQPCDTKQPAGIDERIVQAVHAHLTAKKASEIKAWEEGERQECTHVSELLQVGLEQTVGRKCHECPMESNLWLCLICGSVGCGRKQFDGSGGNSHGAAHYESTGHAASVKLGTISADGDADVYCYVCDDMRRDPKLAEHVRMFGMNIAEARKTEATVAELQLQQNQSFDFKLSDQDGVQFKPAVGFKGLVNGGNSCYISSCVQLLLPILPLCGDHFTKCSRNPAKCPECQTLKLQNGLKQHSRLFNESISAWMFKDAVGAGHLEFSTAKQQDASEFAEYWLSKLEQQCPAATKDFYYRDTAVPSLMLHVNLASGIKTPEEAVDLRDVMRKERVSFTRLGKYLLISVNRIIVENWVPVKLTTLLSCPLELDLSEFIENVNHGKEEADYEEQVAMLVSMGFDQELAGIALQQAKGDVEAAMNLILEGAFASLSMLMEAGFSAKASAQALSKCGNDIERAMDYLLTGESDTFESDTFEANAFEADAFEKNAVGSEKMELVGFISHRGSSMHCGHYVCHVKSEQGWILFNDEKAVIVPTPSLDTSCAYLLLYKKKMNIEY